MQIQTNAKYHFSNRFQGEHRFKLFNDHYLDVRREHHPEPADFRMEVATLNPQARRIERPAWSWLAAGVTAMVIALLLVYFLLIQSSTVGLSIALGGIILTLLLAALCAVVFLRKSERHLVFETRAANYPLVTIPYNGQSRSEAEQFAKQLAHAINERTEQKGYNNEELFAGEMRMLRRLTETGALRSDAYDSAKKRMLEKHKHPPAA